ncbi:MAG: TonB-dependent receptor [Bacteroidia bacterium]
MLIASLQINAQCQLTIKGQIIDLDDGNELADCIVSVLGNEQIVISNNHGRFKLNGLCPGNTVLVIKHFGCRDTSIAINLTKDVFIKVKLPHSSFELHEVDVMDKRIEMKQTYAIERLDQRKITEKSGLPLGELLKEVSGVTTLNTGASISKPMLHGMQGYRLLILNNGIRLEGQQWGNEHAPEIDPFMAKHITVIKGANSLRYGSDAIAGVVLVQANPLPDTTALYGEVNLSGLSNGKSGAGSIMLEGNFEKIKPWNWRVQGSLKKGGNIKTPDYYLSNTGIEEYNFSIENGFHKEKWGADIYYSQFNTKIGIYSGSHISNLTDLKAAYSRSKPMDSNAVFTYSIARPFQEVSHELIKSSIHYHINSKWRLKGVYAWQFNWRKEYDLHLPKSEKAAVAAMAIPQVDYRITSQIGEALIEHDNIRSFRGSAGASLLHQENVYLGRFFIPFYRSLSWGIYGMERYVKQHYEIEAGIRYDNKSLQSFFYKFDSLVSPILNFSNLTYNAGLIWKPDTSFNMFFNFGSAWRSPAVNELYANGIHHGAAAIEKGDENLDVEKVLNASVSGKLNYSGFKFDFSIYHNHFDNFIYLNPSGNSELTIRGAFPVFNYVQTKARISGIDAGISMKVLKHIEIESRYMMVRGWNISQNDHLVFMPSDRGDLSLKFLFNKTNSFDNSFLSVSNSYVSKQWRVPANTDFAPPPEAYYLLGLNLGSDITVKRQKIKFVFSVTNLLNTRYRDYLDRFRYYTDAQGVSYNLRISIPIIIYQKNKNHEK